MHSSMKFMLLSVFLDYECSNSTCNLPLSYYGSDVEIEGYHIIDTELELVETYPETTVGYHGTVTVNFTLQKGTVQQ